MSLYYEVHKVPFIVVLCESKRSDFVLKWFQKNEALIQKWPGQTFKDTLMSFKTKGWEEYLKEGKILHSQLLDQAFVEHIKKSFFSHAQVSFSTHLTPRINRKIETDFDYQRIFDEMISNVEPIQLSYLFQVQEKCFSKKTPNYKLWLTEAPAPINVLNKIAEKIVTIGEGDNFTIDITNMPKNGSAFLTKQIGKLMGVETETNEEETND